MLNSIEQILDSPLKNHLIREIDLANLFKGTSSRRYGLVNKAIQKKELLQIRRGLYALSPKYQTEYFSTYYLANHIVPHSFVTAESALQFHQWIPERIVQTTSAVAFGRNKTFSTPMGEFIYRTTPVSCSDFLTGVIRVEINNHAVFMATPLRAICDYIYWHKLDMADWDFLTMGLRIEAEHLAQITQDEIKTLIAVYHSKRINTFLKKENKYVNKSND